MKDSGLADSMAIDRAADRLVIRMKSAILFSEAQATLTPRGGAGPRRASRRCSRARRAGCASRGTPTTSPSAARQFPSNWELSTARAISVIRYLEDHGIARDRLSVAGYGEFHPLAPNDSAERRALNRRVEIVVLGG